MKAAVKQEGKCSVSSELFDLATSFLLIDSVVDENGWMSGLPTCPHPHKHTREINQHFILLKHVSKRKNSAS